MTKNYREYIGRLAQSGETGRGSVFINRLGIIQFNVKTLMLPDAANSYVAGFGNLINDFTDDVYASVEDRIEHFEEFMENQLFIFRVQSKNTNGTEIRSMQDVQLVPVPKSFDKNTEFYAVPVFCNKNNEGVREWEYETSWNLYRSFETRAEFMACIHAGEGLGSLYGYDLESSSPAFVLWMEEDGKLFAVGSIDRATTDPVGACVLGARYLFTIDLSEFMEYFVYDDSYNPCVSYVPSDIYRKIDNQLKSAVLQAVKDEKEEQRQREAEARAEAERANGLVRILSGLYGVLRPFDLMQPYRLEMGTKLPNPAGKDLYAFWRERITATLNQALADDPDPVLVNLASDEYFSAVDVKRLEHPVLKIAFEEWRDDAKSPEGGKWKVVSFNAKRARGMMTRYAIDIDAKKPEDLRGFDRDGYALDEATSSDDRWVFRRRDWPPAK